MRIAELMSEAMIIPELRASTRDAVLEEIVSCVVEAEPAIDTTAALRVLKARERIGSTGVGQGVAIPHARLPRLERAVACFARSRLGIDFRARDGQPTHLFLALLAPEGNAGFHLKALARASRLLKDSDFRSRLMGFEDAPSIWRAIVAQDNALEG